MQRVMLDYKTAAIVLPLVLILRIMNMKKLFTVLPLGGGYGQVLFAVIIGVIVFRLVNQHKLKKNIEQ